MALARLIGKPNNLNFVFMNRKKKDPALDSIACQVADMVAMYQKEVLTMDEASRYLGISMSKLYKMTSLRQIPHYKSPRGKLNYFNRNELECWAQSNRISTMEELNSIAQSIAARM